MNSNENANIDKFKGVIIEPNGVAHPFGECMMVPDNQLSADSNHDPSFRKEILPQEWWKSYNVPYDENKTIFTQMEDLISLGFSFIINHSCVTARGNHYYCYSFGLSDKSLANATPYLKEVYPVIKRIKDSEESCYFDGEVYKDGVENEGFGIDDIDEFYGSIGILPEKIEESSKVR